MAQYWQSLWMSKKPTSYLDVIQQKEQTQQPVKPKFNLFDFSSVKTQQNTQTPQLNFWQPVSQRNVTNFSDYKKTIPQTPQPATQKSSGFSLIPTANADFWQDYIWELEYDIKNGATTDDILKAYPEIKGNIQLVNELIYDIQNWATLDEVKQAYPELWQTQPTQEQWFLESLKYKPYTPEQISDSATTWEALTKYWKNVAWWLYNILPWVAQIATWVVWWIWEDIKQNVWNTFWLISDEDMAKYNKAKWEKTWALIKWIVKDYSTKYWSAEWFKNAVMTDPTAIIWDALSIIWVWIAWKSKLTNIQKSALETQKANIINEVKKAATLEEKSALIKQWIEASKQIVDKTKTINNLKQAQDVVNKYNPYIQVPAVAWKTALWLIKAPWEILTKWGKQILKTPTLIKKWVETTADVIDTWVEKAATKILGSSDWTKELFKATSPSYNTLSKNKDITKIVNNAKKADEAIVKYWFKPTNTSERVSAYNQTMKNLWNDIEKTRGWVSTKFDASDIAKTIDDEVSKLSVWWVINPAIQKDITALQKQAEYFRKIWKIDIPTLWNQRTLINAITDWGQTTEFWNTFSNVMKKVWWKIREIEDDIITTAWKWKVWDKLQEYWALRNIYDDIVKQDIKALRAKWMAIDESFWRIAWISEALWWVAQLFTNPKQALPTMLSWWAKLLLWKTAWKLKDTDFLIKTWYDKLSKTLKSNLKKNVNNVDNNIITPIKYSEKSAKVSWQTKIKPSILSDREKSLLKPNQSKNVLNKPNKITSETWWEVLKKKSIISKILPSNFKEKAQDLVDKVAEKTWAKTNLLPTNSKQVSKVSDDLISEARKYKSFDEFIESVFSKRAEKQRGWAAPSWKWETLKERMAYDWDVTLREELTKHIKQPDDYFHWYLWPKKYWNDSKTITAIKKWMEDWEITIYRAVPKNVNSWRDWDWVYFVKDKAITHWDIALDWKYNILEKKVSIDDVFWDWNDINEWWYDSWLEKSQLKQIYEQSKKTK